MNFLERILLDDAYFERIALIFCKVVLILGISYFILNYVFNH